MDPVDGSAYIIGGFMSSTFRIGSLTVANFGTGTTISEDIYVAKLMPNGSAATWLKRFGSSGNMDVSTDIEVSGDSVYIAGYFAGGMTLGSSLSCPSTRTCGFVGKLSAVNGSVIWGTIVSSSTGDNWVTNLAVVNVSGVERVVVVGYTWATTFSVGSISIASNGNSDGFIVMLNGTTGAVLNATLAGGE